MWLFPIDIREKDVFVLLIEITKNIIKNELFLYRYSRNISQILTPLRMGIFGATHGWEGG